MAITANATRRAVCGKNKRKNADKLVRTRRHGIPRVLIERVKAVVRDLYDGADMREPARKKVLETRKTSSRSG